jgi:hypothetical protein
VKARKKRIDREPPTNGDVSLVTRQLCYFGTSSSDDQAVTNPIEKVPHRVAS